MKGMKETKGTKEGPFSLRSRPGTSGVRTRAWSRLGARLVFLVALLGGNLACLCSLPPPGIWQKTVGGTDGVGGETYEIEGVTGVTMACIGTLHIEQGGEERLYVEAEANLLPYFEIEVEDGALDIATRPGVELSPGKPVDFYLVVGELESLLLAGDGAVEASGLEVDELWVIVSGSGDVEMEDLEADGLTVVVAGSGDLRVSGQVDEQVVTVSGPGTYRAHDLQSAQARVQVSGDGSATVRVSQRLDVEVSGDGSLRYAGSPTVEETVTGSGSVERIGD